MKHLHSAGYVLAWGSPSPGANGGGPGGSPVVWRVLLIHNTKGHWDLTKGLLEEAEEPDAAAARETEEEIGYRPDRPDPVWRASYTYRYLWHGSPVKKTVHLFLAKVNEVAEFRLSHEHDAFRWCTREDLEVLRLYRGMRRALLLAFDHLEKGGGG